jgi:hypothetical protein
VREEKIEGSAEALWMCHHPFSFPPVEKAENRRTLLQGRMGDQADKNAKDGRTISCCCEDSFPAQGQVFQSNLLFGG